MQQNTYRPLACALAAAIITGSPHNIIAIEGTKISHPVLGEA
jgi:hypothetical protein